ncbi:zinc finger protein 60 isoform X1 [Neodiprion lecontei]|uniref:Zinc finger protein 60 isoform X1 n=2 Tax=Neodiprion lecontei TaxID=441921 RepID=A0ABM3FMH6_NEOLC|nr:zinc finger protein 60 isoform X1 [Neodiprion lecontei]XP_046589220.1 zinc finger protein 60 isoform X1 [Neodiprion lecontei]XP_046589221.1 zinc finger protein 60 isoform X1 [Neodiprion lecontei]XP_046589222.1 zinc finger protein 60 isoform X1 [Neodiprion lecontei]
MSHVSYSKLISLNYPKLCPKPAPQQTLAEVLQSEPVKRLLSQPNIVIETIPKVQTTPKSNVSNNNVHLPVDKKNGPSKVAQSKGIGSEISVMTVETESKDKSRLLPAKGDGKSEIALMVVKPEQKQCGHHGPCENIVCDVSVLQYVDQGGVLPMLAVGIEENEINAPVEKHCKNPLCDALSIDHDRCRRALIKLYRCDLMSACDICGVVFKTRRSRMSHKSCIRKEVYRHNQTDGAQILREKMRERELQMIEAAKTKKKEHLDPATEYKKTMESLRNNKELIIIPKTIPQHQPIVTIKTLSPGNQPSVVQSTNSREVFGKLLPSIPIVFPPQNTIVGKRPGSETNEGPAVKQPKITNVFCTPPQHARLGQQYIKVSSVTQSNIVQPMSLNDWFASQANIVTSSQNTALKPYLTPIRVVPITSLKSAPSLRHQTHGIPAFCLVPDNLPKPVPVSKLQAIQPAPIAPSPPRSVAQNNETENVEQQNSQTAKSATNTRRKSQARRKSEEKNSKVFKCPYCFKGFSTDWYFKMHVAGHTGEMLFTCKTCEKPFSNRYDMKKHMLNEHNDGECRCEICGQISICKSALEIHIRSHTGERPFHCTECDLSYRSSTDLKTHQRKRHNSTDCPYCHIHLVKADLQAHLVSCHQMTEKEALHEILQGQEQAVNGNESSEIEVSDCESMANGILMRIKEELIEEAAAVNETTKFQSSRNGSDSNKRKKQIANKPAHTKSKGNGVHNAEGNQNVCNLKETETKPIVVRRSTRRSNSNFQCTICKENFDSSTLLDDHVANEPKETVECLACKSLFHSQTDYDKHGNSCGKSSCKQSSCLKNSTTGPLRPFQCEICLKVFKNDGKLRIHMNLSPQNFITCVRCGKKFHTNREYRLHMHNNCVELIKCRKCNRQFSNKRTLDNHIC